MSKLRESNSTTHVDEASHRGHTLARGTYHPDLPLLPTPDELVALLSKHVIGHEQAKTDLAVASYNHLMSCAHSDIHGGRVVSEHLILVGPSGSGKSHLFRTLAEKILRIPVFTVDCANIAPYGYKGRDMAQHLDLIAEKVVYENYTNPAIVILEEADKLADDGTLQGSYRRTIQQDFLTFLDGSHCGKDDNLDASRILVIACGAFVGLDRIRDPGCKSVIGFNPVRIPPDSSKSLPPLRPDDLVTFGLIPEFIGRFPRLASLNSLDAAAMRRILIEAESNPLARKKEFFAHHGIGLEFTQDAIDAVAAMATAHPTGARALRLIIDQALRSVEHRLPDMAQEGITSLVYDREAVLGQAPPTERISGSPVFLDSLYELRRRASSYAKWVRPESDVAND